MEVEDGWVKDGEKLVLWIPQHYRRHFEDTRLQFSIGDARIIGPRPGVDLVKLYMYTGERWTDIYQ